MLTVSAFLFVFIGLCYGAHNSPVVEVDTALQNLNLHFNDKLCLDLLLVDCSKHPIAGDEVICATNGQEFQSHCTFVHARCEFLHGPNHIGVANHGPCPSTTMAPVVVSTAAPIVAASTMPPMATSGAPAMTTTTADMTTTTDAATTTAATQPPVGNIIKEVFCRNIDAINCAMAFDLICGSDGQLYPNQCEFSKAVCRDSSVKKVDASNCPFPTATAP